MECSANARLFFIGLWNFCDDHGRHVVSEKQLKALIFPADDIQPENIRLMIDELSSNELIRLYVIDGKEYLQVTGWSHQKIDKPQPPKCPDPPPFTKRTFVESSSNGIEGEERRGKGKEDSSVSNETLVPAERASEPVLLEKPKRQARKDDVALMQDVVADWNALAVSIGLPQVQDITPTRQSAILCRAKDFCKTYELPDARTGFRELFAKIRASPFLCGEVKDFRCDFDFAVRASSFTKIMEGRYEARTAAAAAARR